MSDKINETKYMRFINRTRYSSEDITKLVETYYDLLLERMGGSMTMASSYRGLTENTVFEINDYNPVSTWQEVNEWDSKMSRHRKVTKPFYVKAPGRTASNRYKIGIVEPDKLHRTHVEALADTSGVAPLELTQQLFKALRGLHSYVPANDNVTNSYTATREASDNMAEKINREDFRIRIEAKRESSPASEASRERNRKAAAAQKSQKTYWAVRAAHRELSEALARYVEFKSVAKKAGIKVSDKERELEDALQLLHTVKNELETIHKTAAEV